ncbi:fermitin family homolog 3-like [Vidua chalybeata]|uniref:fermitin family homolog 3-like n=1 Tax=Vidua chalybeata TaxID=81927 RepID=UPI0023A8D18A|nr:fermitin family homolog 3-like [Vidua chalybeata]
MAGLKTATGEEIDGSFELRVEGQPRVLTLCVTGDLHVGGLVRRILGALGDPRPWADHALWWEQQRRWLLGPSPTLDALGVGGGSRLRFAPRHRPLRLRLPGGGVLRLRLNFAGTPGRAVATACGLLGVSHPEELSLLRPERGEGRGAPPAPPELDLTHLRPRTDEAPPPPLPPELLRALRSPKNGGRGPPGPPRSPPGNAQLRRARLHARWLDVGRSLLEQGVAEDEELQLRFKYPCATGLDPQEGPRVALLQEEALGAILAEEIECSEEQGLRFAALQYQIEGEEWGDGGDPQDPPEPPDLDTALERLELSLGGGGTPGPAEELGAPPELQEELEICRPSPWPFWGSRPAPARAVLSGSSLSLWTPPGPGGPQEQLNLRGCEVTPQVDLGAQKFGIKLRLPSPGGGGETLLQCRDAPQFSRWVCGCRAAAGGGSPSAAALRAQIRGVLGVLGVQPDGGDPPGTPPRPPPDPRRLLPPRLQRRLKGKQFTQRLLEVLLREGPLSPPQARLRFVEAWRALPGFGLGHFVVRFRGAPQDELLAVGPSRLLRLPLGSGAVRRSWSHRELQRWDVNWDSQQVRLWLSGDVTLALRVLSAPPRALHQFLGGYLALGGPPRDPRELQRLMEGGYDP